MPQGRAMIHGFRNLASAAFASNSGGEWPFRVVWRDWLRGSRTPGFAPRDVMALGLGAVAALLQPVLPAVWVVLVVAVLGVWLAWRGGFRRWLSLALLTFVWTTLHAFSAVHARLPHELEGRDIRVQGQVINLPRDGRLNTRFEFRVEQAWLGQDSLSLHGVLRLAWYGFGRAALQPCTRWNLTVRLKRPHGMVNPGGYDAERQAVVRGLIARGYVRDTMSARRLGTARLCIDTTRAQLSSLIARDLQSTGPVVALLQALAVGDKRGLGQMQWRVLRATGVSHLVAISGLHVGLVGIFGALLVRLAWWCFPGLGLRWPRRRVEAGAALALASVYAALAGFSLPTVRALLMIGVAAWALGGRRHISIVQALGLAFAAVVGVDPLALLAPGTWLSFVGVAMLIFTLSSRRGIKGWLLGLGHAQAVMTLGLLPLSILFFGMISRIGPLANVVAVPFMSLVVVPLDLVGTLLSLVEPRLGTLVLRLAAWLLGGLWQLLEHMAAWPIAIWHAPASGFLPFVLASIGVLWMLAPRGVPGRVLGLPLLLPLLIPGTHSPGSGHFDAFVFDVGQGLSVLVRTSDHALLYDAGPRYPSGYDLGASVVLPSLSALGVHRLDRLMIDHGDMDHAGGAVRVHEAFPRAQLLGNEPQRVGLPLQPCIAGMHWRWDGVDFEVLHPSHPGRGYANDDSCVLLVKDRNMQLLLPGDISKRIEARLSKTWRGAGPPLVLLAAHHGSRTSSSEKFLQALKPSKLLISAGYRSRHGHPHPQVIARYRQLSIPYWNTASGGTLHVYDSKKGAEIVTYRQRFRAWWRE